MKPYFLLLLALAALFGCSPPENLGLVFESMSIDGHECVFVQSASGLDETQVTELVNHSVDSDLPATLKAFGVPEKNVRQITSYIDGRVVILYFENDREEDIATLVFDGAVVRAAYAGVVSVSDLIEAGDIQEKSVLRK